VSLAGTVNKLSKPKKVVRLSEFATVGGRDDGSQTETVAVVKIAVQPTTSPSTRLSRQIDGDETEGEARVWVTSKNVAKAYLDGDITKTPIGWTQLRVAPPEGTDGPPGDRVEAYGRRWELVELQQWEAEGFSGPSGFDRYIARERGAATL